MPHHSELFSEVLAQLENDAAATGIMLTGSVARGTATMYSDLNIVILYNCDKVVKEWIDGILVKCVYMTLGMALRGLRENPAEPYMYIDAVVCRDSDGTLSELQREAQARLMSYRAGDKYLGDICSRLSEAVQKLRSAREDIDLNKLAFLTATNSWTLLEGIWARNNRPMPPQGSLMDYARTLTHVPHHGWLEELFPASGAVRADTMLNMIAWVLGDQEV